MMALAQHHVLLRTRRVLHFTQLTWCSPDYGTIDYDDHTHVRKSTEEAAIDRMLASSGSSSTQVN